MDGWTGLDGGAPIHRQTQIQTQTHAYTHAIARTHTHTHKHTDIFSLYFQLWSCEFHSIVCEQIIQSN